MFHTIEKQDMLNSTLRRWTSFPLHVSQRKILLISVDLILLGATYMFSVGLSRDMPLSYTTVALDLLGLATLTFLWLIIALVTDAYDVKKAAQMFPSVFAIIKTLLITGVIYVFLGLILPSLFTEWSSILVMITMVGIIIVAWRIIYVTVLVQPNFQRRALVMGTGESGRTITKAIKEHDSGYEIVGYVVCAECEQNRDIKDVITLGEWANLPTFVKEHDVSDIILAVRGNMQVDQLQAVLKCFELGVRIVTMPDLFEEITNRIPVEHIDERWLTSLPLDWDSRGLYLFVKRAMDIFMAGSTILILTPFFFFVALAIKLDSQGPIFYRPKRLGQGGKPFLLWKFRTMVPNADRIGDPTFTAKNDQRITRIGRLLRAIHVDELPQIVNILKGEMSLVGPRPERYVPELEENIPYYRTRYAVKPGATGLALIKQGYANGLEGTRIKLQYDLYYIKHQSLYLDLLILIKTAIHMVTMRGQ